MTVQSTPPLESAAVEAPKTAEVNLVNMRKALEAKNEENARIKQRLEELERQTKKAASASRIDDDEDDDAPYIDSRSLKKKLSRLEEQFEEKIERKAEQKARELMDVERRKNYLQQNPEFEKTMAPDMIQKFAEKYPSMAEAILNMPDGFERQKLVYESIKNTGVNKPAEAPSNIQQKIDANRRSPYYIPSSQGTAPYGGASDFSEAGQKNAFNKMKELQKGLRIR
jgi:hypothetical protein